MLIGASNGFSITEGLHLFANNQAFHDIFGDFERKYRIPSIIHGCMVQWQSEAEQWAFISRMLKHYMLDYKVSPVMKDLRRLVGEKSYFILTTNGECHFQMAGFKQENIYEIEGNWSTMQCARACHNTLYPTAGPAEQMAEQQQDCRVPEYLIPKCPKCGGRMMLHMETDRNFLTDFKAQEAFTDFLRKYRGKKVVILELGVGDRNGIRGAFIRYATAEPNWTYVTVNLDQLTMPPALDDRAIRFRDDLEKTLHRILEV